MKLKIKFKAWLKIKCKIKSFIKINFIYKGKSNWRESESCRTYDGSFLIKKSRAQARVDIFEIKEKKIRQSRKSKSSTLNDAHTNQRISMRKLYSIWSNGDGKGSVILPVRRVYISIKTIVIAKTTRYRKIHLFGYRIK